MLAIITKSLEVMLAREYIWKKGVQGIYACLNFSISNIIDFNCLKKFYNIIKNLNAKDLLRVDYNKGKS
jgi:hypothetical protein